MAAEATGALSIPGPDELEVLVPKDVRRCGASRGDGQPCGATPQRDSEYCFSHDPAKRELAADARRLGGLHRRQEKTVRQVYDVRGLATPQDMLRHLEVTAAELFALPNSVARDRALIAVVPAAIQVLEHGELVAEVAALRAEVDHRAGPAADDQDGQA
jgi:hypothetical protein